MNACGIDDFHDGVNYTRTACVIAVSKARDLFEPFLHQLGYRLSHILRRMLPIAMHLLQRDGQFLNGHDLFLKRVGAAYHAFIEEAERGSRWVLLGWGGQRAGRCWCCCCCRRAAAAWCCCRDRPRLRLLLKRARVCPALTRPLSLPPSLRRCSSKSMEDLQSTTRYVTWSLHTKSRSSLKTMLSKVTTPSGKAVGNGAAGGAGAPGAPSSMTDFLENTLWNRTLGSMSEEIVAALVCQIFEGERAGGPRGM